MRERLVPRALSLKYRGSVKDVYGGDEGKSVFLFSDRYSIFDWGEMPDAFPGKGEALAVMGDVFFRFLAEAKNWKEWSLPAALPAFLRETIASSPVWTQLKREGLSHHSFGLVDEDGHALPAGSPSKRLCVQELERIHPRSEKKDGKLVWDYSEYAAAPERVLVPLEVVFRFGAPSGSSFLRRLQEIPGYAKSFGFTEAPQADEWFPFPVAEFFTKLEPTDRYLSREEALEVSGMSPAELERLTVLTLLIAMRLKDLFARIGLELWDGKFEYAFLPPAEGEKERRFQLVDSIGPDELRLIGRTGGSAVHFSKELLRAVYRGSEWYGKIELAKKAASVRGEKDWKKIAREEYQAEPEKLSPKVLEAAADLYPSLAKDVARECLGLEIYPAKPKVSELLPRLKECL